jgi:hypothetical protein
MARSTRFAGWGALQLCVPAALYLAAGLYNGRTSGLKYLLPNYLFMALPLLLVSLLAIWPNARRPALLWVLSLLNVLLIAFQLWVLLAVPRHESGLAWLFYVPLWGAALLASVIIWLIAKRKGAGQPVGT